eukprot:GILK01008013.1.p1 GENE.GILK01008013.1~~GILK01008013.1.p1  ORF type:complete len:451 (-),score=45.37 GILK01008013.1:113-1465(-)
MRICTCRDMAQQGYKGFGSFHSENVELLIRIPDAEYAIPPLPFTLTDVEPIEHFGRACKESHFLLDPSFVFINHGAFGAPVKYSFENAQRWREHTERQPLTHIDRELLPYMVYCLRQFAPLIGCQPWEFTFMPNVTTALNTVIQSIEVSAGDEFYMLDVGYGAVKKLAQYICTSRGGEVNEQHVSFPTSDDEIVSLVERTLKPNTKLAIFDHITSNTAMKLPVKRLVDLCHSRSVPVLIDGAHALFSVDLNLAELGADFYAGNCHKWFCNPRGCGFLYINEKYRATTRSLIVSHGFGSGFTSEFIWDGARDYTATLAVLATLNFWRSIGSLRATDYIRNLLKEAVEYLTTQWRTDILVPLSMCAFMACVRLPLQRKETEPFTSTHAKIVQDTLHYQFKVEVPVKSIQGQLYVRISIHIYNEITDYNRLCECVREMKKIDFNDFNVILPEN